MKLSCKHHIKDTDPYMTVCLLLTQPAIYTSSELPKGLAICRGNVVVLLRK